MSDQSIEVIYTPQSPLRHPRKFFGEMLLDLKKSREISWRLFVRNIRGQYSQPLLGYVWVILPPLTWTLVWIYLRRSGVIGFFKRWSQKKTIYRQIKKRRAP